jgi:hypothetical protein
LGAQNDMEIWRKSNGKQNNKNLANKKQQVWITRGNEMERVEKRRKINTQKREERLIRNRQTKRVWMSKAQLDDDNMNVKKIEVERESKESKRKKEEKENICAEKRNRSVAIKPRVGDWG